mgnify:CR=1 FL=1
MSEPADLLTDDGRVDARLLSEGREPKIDRATCATVRVRVRDGKTLRAVAAQLGVAHSTIGHHARGECDHDHDDTPPVARGGDA